MLLNIQTALEAARLVAAAGLFPILPHTMGSHESDWETAMKTCRALIRGLDPARDILVTLPNWAESRGAREEVALAIRLGIRVVPAANL